MLNTNFVLDIKWVRSGNTEVRFVPLGKATSEVKDPATLKSDSFHLGTILMCRAVNGKVEYLAQA